MLYVYVCVYVSMCVCTYVCVYMCMCVCIFVCVYTCVICCECWLVGCVLMQELSNAMISQWKKEAMRASLEKLKKLMIEADKNAKAKLVQQVREIWKLLSCLLLVVFYIRITSE